MKDFFGELKRRHVFRVGIAYLVVAWLALQLVNNLVTPLRLPDWTATLIVVLLGIGFPIALVLAWAYDVTPEGVKRTAATDEAAPAASTGRKLDFVIIAALVLALGYFAWDRYHGAPLQQTTAQSSPSNSAATATSAMPTLAVLPLADFSPDKDQEGFADGMTDELLNALARLKGLQVTGRTSSFYFKGKGEDLRTVGEKLGVENVLEGSVTKDGDKLRVIAQLINAKTGYHIWSQTYDRKLTDIFTVQDDIVKAVAEALQIALGVGDLGRQPGMTRNVDAYAEYLQSQQVFSPTDREAFLAVTGHLERAVNIDPNFGLAWLVLAQMYSRIHDLFPGQAQDAARKAREDFSRAQTLTPDAPQIFGYLADQAQGAGRWLKANEEWSKALAAAKKYADSAIGPAYGAFLAHTGQVKAAVRYMEEGRAIEPLDIRASDGLAFAYDMAGDVAAALKETDRGMALEGDAASKVGYRYDAMFIALDSGNKAEIIKYAKSNTEIGLPGKTKDVNEAMLKHLDDPRMALMALKQFDSKDSGGFDPGARWMTIAWASYLGDPAFALERLVALPASSRIYYAGVTLGPLFRDVRKLPGYKAFLTDSGLVDYWRKSGNWADLCRSVGDNDFECT